MSAISLKSITGITSITTPAGVDNQLTLHNNNTTEAVKLDGAGNLHFHNHLNITGVTTTSDSIKIQADNKYLSIGAHSGGDLLAYHDGNKSVLVNYTGDFHIRTNNGSRSSLEGIILKPNGATEIYHSGSKIIETDSLGINVLGRLDVSGTGANDHLNVDSNTTRLRIGGYADLQIYHDSTNINYIENYNDVDLHIKSTYGGSPSKTQAKFIHNGAVELYHNNIKRLETSSVGVSIPQDLDVDGHTNLDNVSVAGVTTFTGNANFGSNGYISGGANFSLTSNNLRVTGSDTVGIECQRAGNATIQCTDTSNSTDLQLRANSSGGLVRTATNKALILGTYQKSRIQITNDGKVQIGLPGSSTSLPGAVDVVNIRAMTDGNLCVRAIGSIASAPSGSGVGIDVLNDANNAVKDLALRGSTIIFKNASNESARIDSNGNLMIGRTSASKKFSIEEPSGSSGVHYLAQIGGSNHVSGYAVGIAFDPEGYSARTKMALVAEGTSQGYSRGKFHFLLDAANDSGEATLSESRMTITDAGKVGINETNPQQQLHVHDDNNYKGILINGNSAPRIAFARSTSTTGEWSVGIDGTNGNNFVINRSNDNSNRYFVISNGQTNSNQNTVVNGVFFNNDIRSTTGTNDDSTSNVKISARNAAGGHGNYCIIGVSGNTYFGAGANNYSSNPSGNNINGGTTIRVYGGISSNAYQDAHRFGRDTDGSIVIFQSAGGTEGSIAISGSTTNYNTSSDYRLKDNIVNITDGITRLKQLKPRRFNFIKDPSITKDGFIAHEVDSVVPEAVTGTKDETFSKDDEANNVKAGDPKYQHMDASKLIPLLTAALQEAITEIETLKTKVAALESS